MRFWRQFQQRFEAEKPTKETLQYQPHYWASEIADSMLIGALYLKTLYRVLVANWPEIFSVKEIEVAWMVKAQNALQAEQRALAPRSSTAPTEVMDKFQII